MASLRFLVTNLIEATTNSLMNGSAVVAGNVNECAIGVAAITRASGSYITAGVKPGALVSGAIAARFAANTYVRAVSALTLTMSANAGSSTAGAEGATFTPYVALDEVSPYVMTNAMTHDRGVLWQKSSASDLNVDFDLGSDKTISCGGLAAHRGIGGSTGIGVLTIQGSTSAAGYPPATGGSWTTHGTFTGTILRNKGLLWGSTTARYIRFALDITGGTTGLFTLGKFLLGVLDYDLTFLYSLPVNILGISPNAEDRSIGTDLVRTYTGDDREMWELPYRDVLNATVTILDTLRKTRTSFILIDKSDVFREFVVQGGALPRSLEFEYAADTRQNAQFNLEELP